MTYWQIGGLSAITLILVALAVPCSPLHVSTWWPDLTGFVGARARAWLRWRGWR